VNSINDWIRWRRSNAWARQTLRKSGNMLDGVCGGLGVDCDPGLLPDCSLDADFGLSSDWGVNTNPGLSNDCGVDIEPGLSINLGSWYPPQF